MIASKRYLTQLRRASLKRRRRSARNSIWIRSNAVHGRHVAKARSASRTDRSGQMSADSSGEKQILLLNATLIYVNRTSSVCVPFQLASRRLNLGTAFTHGDRNIFGTGPRAQHHGENVSFRRSG